MNSLYLWPDRPALSLVVLWIVSVVLLWAARDAALALLGRLARSLHEGLEGLARWCTQTADRLRERSRAGLLAAGELELRGKLAREFHRIDSSFSERLGQYSVLHRRLDDTVRTLEADYARCGDAPPDVPGWSAAAETIAQLPTSPDPNVARILDGIRRSSRDAEKKALAAHREVSAKRHKILGGIMPMVREIKGLLSRMQSSVDGALETTQRVNEYMAAYQSLDRDAESALRALTFSAGKLFVVSLIVLAIALGGAFINFQLIALPMSELVPAGARVGGVPVATISALVIVLMEAAVGLFLMEMLGITELFPRLASIPASRRRLVLGVAFFGLFFLAAVESSLAVLREQIVEADAALKLALSGDGAAAVAEASSSRIPVIGQAVLGFVLPWLLALVAVPLEMLLDSGRHVSVSVSAFALALAGSLARVLAHVCQTLFGIFPNLYDVYVAIPLRIERAVRGEEPAPRRRDTDSTLVVRPGETG